MDPDIDMDEETSIINERVFAAARTKLAMSSQARKADPAEAQRRDTSAAGQVLAQSAASAELLQKRAAAAARSLQQEADQARRRTQAAAMDHVRRERDEPPSDYQQQRKPRNTRRADWYQKDQKWKRRQ